MTHIVCVLKTNEGGLWIVPQLEELRSRGHDVTMIVPEGGGRLTRALVERGIRAEETSFNFSYGNPFAAVRALVRLRKQIALLKPDVVFYHLYASALACRISTIGMSLRRVHMVAGPLYLDSPLIRRLERFLCRLDDHIIAGSEHTARRYAALGVPKKKLSAVPYGVDLDHFRRSGVPPEASVDRQKFTAIMVAYFYAPKSRVYPGVGIKGHEVILPAWKRFTTEYPDSSLILLGGGFGDLGEEHRRQLRHRSHDMSHHIRWIDSVDDVRPWYAAADVSVSPSLSENHGAALEASAMECPSIVSDAGALPEAVLNGVSGWVVPVGDVSSTYDALVAARRLWQQGALSVMGASARSYMVNVFDLRECSKHIADLILRTGTECA